MTKLGKPRACTVPEAVIQEAVKHTGDKNGMSAFKRIVKYGLMAAAVMADPEAKLIIRQGDKEREIVL